MHVREATCADVPGIARVHVDSWRTTYRGIVPDEVLAELSYARREELWRRILCADDRSTFVYVALDGNAIVGFASAGPERGDDPARRGELGGIYLLQSHQRRGLGRSLFALVCARLRVLGFDSMVLSVAAENHSAVRFYEALGGQPISRKMIVIGRAPIETIVYCWALGGLDRD